MLITNLPKDIFLLLVAYLSPLDLILCRRVCKSFYAAFTDPELSRHILLWHYPRSRELRLFKHCSAFGCNWASKFSKVAGRYYHLKSGTPQSIERLALARSHGVPTWARYHPIAPWQRHLQFEEKTAHLQYPDPLWTYDDGILVYPSADLQGYVIYDLETKIWSRVHFEPEGMIVRRMRLKERTLVVEWCEGNPYHRLNETEEVHRHFATAYDLVRHDEQCFPWKITFRNEWKIHFLGMPLNTRDRFFSAHTATKYAMFLWQPNRSAWGEDEPIETLAVWDISSPSAYRPSKDPSCKFKPSDCAEGSKLVRRFSFADLDFYGIRQRSTPMLRCLELDENHVYVVEEAHRWEVGQQSSDTLPRLHKVKTNGIPFASGPQWVNECGADGDVNLSFCQRVSDIRRPGLAPCWRHEEFPYLTITEAVDADAGVTFSARHCFMMETISLSVKPRVQMTGPNYQIALSDTLWPELLSKGVICGDERWLLGENGNQEVVILYFDAEG